MNILKNAVNAVKRLGNLELESVKGVESRGAKVFQGSKNISKIKRKVAESAANSRRTLFIETPGCKGVNTASTGPESVHILHMKWTLQDTNKLLNETKGQKTKSSLFYPFSAGKDRSINKQRVLLLTFYKPFVLSAGWDKLHFTSNPDPFKLAHLLEGLAVFLWGHYGGQEQLHVADCLLHDHVKHTQQGAPLIQHLLGGRCGEIPGKHTHRGQTDADKQIQTGDANTHIDLHYTVQLKITLSDWQITWSQRMRLTVCSFWSKPSKRGPLCCKQAKRRSVWAAFCYLVRSTKVKGKNLQHSGCSQPTYIFIFNQSFGFKKTNKKLIF